jgi:SAM-dependent methyltransferase
MGTELNPQPARDCGLDVRAGVEQVPCEAQFDCVTMWHTLEHMRDIKSTLKQIGGLLKPDGKLFIAVPDNSGFQAKAFMRKWIHLDVPRHLVHFDANSLEYCLGSAGYSIHRLWHQEFEYDLLGWSQSALNCIIPYPNVFFDFLTGKQKKYGKWITVSSFMLGSALTFLAVPFVAAGTLAGRGGTIVVAAGRTKGLHRA